VGLNALIRGHSGHEEVEASLVWETAVFDVAENRRITYWAQEVGGKILSRKDLMGAA
jgi:hypothetical protein